MDEFGAGMGPVVDSAGFREILAIMAQAIAISLVVFLTVASVVGVVSLILKETRKKREDEETRLRCQSEDGPPRCSSGGKEAKNRQ